MTNNEYDLDLEFISFEDTGLDEVVTEETCPICGYPIVIEYGLEVCYYCGWSRDDEV